MIILEILLGLIVGIFAIHFIGLYISPKIHGWRKKICNNFEIATYKYCKSLMVSIYQYQKWYVEEECIDKHGYSHSLVIQIGGFNIRFKYGHNYAPDNDYSGDFCISKNYGLYSIDGEIWWTEIWWGKHLYSNPFACNKFLGHYIMEPITGTLYNDKMFKDYNYPTFFDEKNVTYINKNGVKQNIPHLQITIEERAWTFPILYWLHLTKLYTKKIVDLEITCSNDGDNDFNGCGVITNDWKGGVYKGSPIQLNDYPELFKMYNNITVKHKVELMNEFHEEILRKINYFLTEQRKW